MTANTTTDERTVYVVRMDRKSVVFTDVETVVREVRLLLEEGSEPIRVERRLMTTDALESLSEDDGW